MSVSAQSGMRGGKAGHVGFQNRKPMMNAEENMPVLYSIARWRYQKGTVLYPWYQRYCSIRTNSH